jgi:hypothetical protein
MRIGAAGTTTLTSATSTAPFIANIGASEVARIDSSGRLGLGTSTPTTALSVIGQAAAGTTGFTSGMASGFTGLASFNSSALVEAIDGLYLRKSGTDASAIGISFGNAAGDSYFVGARIKHIRSGSNSNGHLTFETKSDGSTNTTTERLRITSDGRLGLGTSSPDARLDVNDSGADSIVIRRNGGSDTNTNLRFQLASSYWALGVGSDDSFGIARNSVNTAIGSTFRISSGGNVGIGVTSPGELLEVGGNIHLSGNNRSIFNRSNNDLLFGTNNTERMRIDNAGNVGIARSNPLSTLHVGGLIRANTTATATTTTTGLISVTSASIDTGNVAIETTSNSTVTRHHISFVNPNGVVGSISTNASATAYNTSSDYRLKENVVPLSGAIDRLQQIPVHRFNFIADPDTVVDGFIAHEAQEIVPECVTGTKDEVDEDGNPVMQGIDQSKIVPLLTAALQEAITRIQALEAEVTALKGA